jgi:hypothetical protein
MADGIKKEALAPGPSAIPALPEPAIVRTSRVVTAAPGAGIVAARAPNGRSPTRQMTAIGRVMQNTASR